MAIIGVTGLLLGVPLLFWLRHRYPRFYRGERLPRWPVPYGVGRKSGTPIIGPAEEAEPARDGFS